MVCLYKKQSSWKYHDERYRENYDFGKKLACNFIIQQKVIRWQQTSFFLLVNNMNNVPHIHHITLNMIHLSSFWIIIPRYISKSCLLESDLRFRIREAIAKGFGESDCVTICFENRALVAAQRLAAVHGHCVSDPLRHCVYFLTSK